MDVDLSYGTTFSNGHQLNARMVAVKALKLNNFIDPENPSVPDRQLSELGDPELVLNLDLGYTIGDLEMTYNLRYLGKQTIGAYEDQHAFNGNPPTNADLFPSKYYPEEYIHGIRGEYAVSEQVRVFGGVDNLTDSLPPLGLLGIYAGDPYDSIGRYFYFGMTFDM